MRRTAPPPPTPPPTPPPRRLWRTQIIARRRRRTGSNHSLFSSSSSFVIRRWIVALVLAPVLLLLCVATGVNGLVTTVSSSSTTTAATGGGGCGGSGTSTKRYHSLLVNLNVLVETPWTLGATIGISRTRRTRLGAQDLGQPLQSHGEHGNDDMVPEQSREPLDEKEAEDGVSCGSNVVVKEEDYSSLSPWSLPAATTTKGTDHLEQQQVEEQQQQRQAVWLLNAVAIIWGTQHAIIKTVVMTPTTTVALPEAVVDSAAAAAAATTTADVSSSWFWDGSVVVLGDTLPAAMFTLIRFSLAALLASPYTPGLNQLFKSTLSTRPNNQHVESTLNTNDNGVTETIFEDAEWTISTEDDEDDTLVVANETTSRTAMTMIWRWGIELGIYMFLGFAFQAIGLQFTTAQKSGFLLYLNCKFVPIFAAILFGRSIASATWISAIVAVLGTGLLAWGSSSGAGGAADGFATIDSGGIAMTTMISNLMDLIPNIGDDMTTTMMTTTPSGGAATPTTSPNDWNVGDLWSIAAAMTSAMFILRMEQASEAVAESTASQLNAACLWIVTLLAVLWTLAATLAVAADTDATTITTLMSSSSSTTTTTIMNTLEMMKGMVQNSWPCFLYLGGIATAMCNWLQTKAQRYVNAERACVIYAMDPVYGALFSAWWLGESLPGVPGYLGATLITIAAATNAFFLPNNHSNTHNNNNDDINNNKNQEGLDGKDEKKTSLVTSNANHWDS